MAGWLNIVEVVEKSLFVKMCWLKKLSAEFNHTETCLRCVYIIEMKGMTRCKLTISESAVCKKFLGYIVSYPASLYIFNSHSLECYVVI